MRRAEQIPVASGAGRATRYLRKGVAWRAGKRGFDLLLAGVGLLLSAPLFVLIALAIKLDGPGPVFFRQLRVGRCRRPFSMWKFRKMPDDLPEQGPLLTARNDARLTRIGRWLERSKLDELPQLLNVLAGEMSVVGPRPEVSRFVDRGAHELWDRTLSVKPGIFGPNQVRYRNEADLYPPGCTDVETYYLRHILPEKLEVDARYAAEARFLSDVALLVRGVLVSVFGIGGERGGAMGSSGAAVRAASPVTGPAGAAAHAKSRDEGARGAAGGRRARDGKSPASRRRKPKRR
jgi:lipopolysaccharide/colanic/teichoic acid biosynthesis glycosyltransferase